MQEANHAGRYNTKHFLTLTPAGAESDLIIIIIDRKGTDTRDS